MHALSDVSRLHPATSLFAKRISSVAGVRHAAQEDVELISQRNGFVPS